VAVALAAAGLAGGIAVTAGGGASAEVTRPDATSTVRGADAATREVDDAPPAAAPASPSGRPGDETGPRRTSRSGPGAASMSSPYVPGVAHVPADVLLVLGPGGSEDGARYVGPEGSLFNGPVDEVGARIDAWWAEQMAAGVTPEKADELLARPHR
jgi:hypothetical protein